MNWIRPFLLGVILTALINIPIYFHYRNARIETARQRAAAQYSPPEMLPQSGRFAPRPNSRFAPSSNLRPAMVVLKPPAGVATEQRVESSAVESSGPVEAPPEGANLVAYQFAGRAITPPPVVPQTLVLQQVQRPEQKLPGLFSNLPDGRIVPNAPGIFFAMDLLGAQSWAAAQRPFAEVVESSGTRVQKALFLGALFAETFIAIEVQDAEQVSRLCQSIRKIGVEFRVSKAAQVGLQTIVRRADAGAWLEAQIELRSVLVSDRALIALGHDELAGLACLGGWLRAAEATSAVLIAGDTKSDFEKSAGAQLAKFDLATVPLNKTTREDPLFVKAHKSMQRIKDLLHFKAWENPPEKNVQEIHKIAAAIVDEIYRIPRQPALK